MSPDLLLRRARDAAGLTQAELAERMGVPQPAVARLERSGANPTVETLDRALRAAGRRLTLGDSATGVPSDLTMVRSALRLTPRERLEQFEHLYAVGRRMAAAGARARGDLA